MATKEERKAKREARNAELKAKHEAKRVESQAKYEVRKAELQAKLAESQAKAQARKEELAAAKDARKREKEAKLSKLADVEGTRAGRLAEIREQLASLDDVSTLLARHEINDLPDILGDDERVNGALQGKYGRGQGLLVATDRRLVFVDKKLIGNRVKVEDFPYDRISSIQYELKLMFATVTVFTSGNKAEIEQVMPKGSARSFCEAVRALISGEHDRQPVISSVLAVQRESELREVEQLADALERLAQLRDRGLLSDDQFTEQKRRLLSKSGH